MRSKNLLPLQVVMPSNWMGVTQSSHKIAFEEALHNSIENSLRSPSVTPSAVFSSLFFTYRPSSASSTSVTSDVKSGVDELDPEVVREIPNSSELREQHSPATSLSYYHPARPALPASSAEPRGPPALLNAVPNDRHQSLQDQRRNIQTENRPTVSSNQSQVALLTQQQQIEQIQQARIEQFKQLQKIQAWQQMQKDQQFAVGSRLMVQGPRDVRPPHIPAPAIRPSIPSVPRSTTTNFIQPQMNGFQHNGVIPPIQTAFNLHRNDRPVPVTNINGFCKAGKDIRLSRLEQDCSQMMPYPPEYVLLAIQPTLGRGDNIIVVALNLKSLPPPNSSSQALSAQCIGCGEKSIHTFPQLAAHVGIEPGTDIATSRLNSSQLIGSHGRFYLVRDPTNPLKLVRGSPSIWYKNNEAERMRLLSTVSQQVQTSTSAPLIRGSMIMVNPTHQRAAASGPPQEIAADAHPLVSPYASISRPQLKRAISNPIQKKPVEAGKRQYSSYSQDDVVVIQDEPTPKRYLLEDRESWRKVEIPENLSSADDRKPVIAFLHPLTNLPLFVGDLTSVIITSHFAECLKPPSQEAMKRLKISKHCSLTYSKFVLFSTVQYLTKLGQHDPFSNDGFSACLMECRQKFIDETANCFTELKSSDVVLIAQLASANSNSLVEVVHCKTSVIDGLKECLKNYRPSVTKYYVLVHIGDNNELSFHLFLSGNINRSVEESLRPREGLSSIVSQGLVSLQFSQLRISLSEVSKQCYHNRSTSKLKTFNSKSSVSVQRACSMQRSLTNAFASALFAKVEQIFRDNWSDLEISDFTSLRFLFLVPPSTSQLTETLKCVSKSDILSQIYKTSLPVSTLSSQIVATNDDSSLQRITSICKQWQNTSTLFFIIQLDAHLTNDKSKIFEFLNSNDIRQSSNIFHIQCTSFPYPLLTNNSRFPTDNIVHLEDIKNDELLNSNEMCSETLVSVCTKSATFDPVYEEQKDILCNRYQLLHSSLIVCEILTHQYIASLALTSSLLAQDKQVEKYNFKNLTSPIINQVTQDLLGLGTSSESIVIVRVTSSILATRFYDNLRQARHRFGLNEAFEILLYSGDSVAPAILLSKHFLDCLQAKHVSEQEWRPTCLKDLSGIPCLIVYVGDQLVSQTLPSTLKYVDCRMAFHGSLDRFHIEQELSLVSSLCVPCSNNKKMLPTENESKSLDNGVTNSHNHTQPSHPPSKQDGDVNNANYNWAPPEQKLENGFRNQEEEANAEHQKDDVLFDFIGLAMKEADLPADDNNFDSSDCCHSSPVAILPESIYSLIKNKADFSLRDLIPHPASKWSEPLHPSLKDLTSPSEEIDFYRQWTSPSESNPDFDNMEQSTNENRILLITPSNCQAQSIFCQFLQSLRSDISKALKISVFDDPEEIVGVSDGGFHCSLANNVARGVSQIVNSFTDGSHLQRFLAADLSKPTRSVVVRHCPFALTFVKRFKHLRNGSLTNGDSIPQIEYSLKIGTKDWIFKDNGMELKIVIPSTQTDKFRFSVLEDGSVELMSLKLKLKDEIGVKTPVCSIGVDGAKGGLYTLQSGSSCFTHIVLIKACDADAYKIHLSNQIIVVLPEEFNFLGKGAMKYAAQALYEHFYAKEKDLASDADSVWPFFLLLDDDVAAFSKLCLNNKSQVGDTLSWCDVSFLEMVQTFESIATDNITAVGFRPWSHYLPTTLQPCGKILGDNCLIKSCVEKCLFLNCKSANTVKFSNTKFSNEDVDWSLRAAAIGLNLYRFENIAMVTKVVEPLSCDVALENTQTPLVTTADSEFLPLYHHPALLLEKYLPQCAPLMFPGARCQPEIPVLCVDCCMSLGNQVCIQFVSSQDNAKPWAVDRSKKYGGLILSSPSPNIKPEFLDGFQFIGGAVVCVVSTDRSSLRQTVVSLQLESSWHFRLTDEFQTTNHSNLGGFSVRPWYFLTGAKKES